MDYGWNDTATSIFCYTHYIILVQTLWQRLLSRSLSVCINLCRLAALCFVTLCVHMTCCIWTVLQVNRNISTQVEFITQT